MSIIRFLILLSLIVWIGGIIFLSFIEAPVAFSVAPTRHMAGTVVGHTLSILHWVGLFSGVIFLGCSMLLTSLTTGSAQPFAARHVLVAVMLLLLPRGLDPGEAGYDTPLPEARPRFPLVL